MTRPSKFEIMRHNRSKGAKPLKATLRQRIDDIEAEMEAEWGAVTGELAALQENLAWARERQLPRRPSRLRRLVNWTMGMGAAA